MSGTDNGYAATRSHTRSTNRSSSMARAPVFLRISYAMSGTDFAYEPPTPPYRPRLPYALSGTDIAYGRHDPSHELSRSGNISTRSIFLRDALYWYSIWCYLHTRLLRGAACGVLAVDAMLGTDIACGAICLGACCVLPSTDAAYVFFGLTARWVSEGCYTLSGTHVGSAAARDETRHNCDQRVR
eukprot:496535-Rhodomonas_salina.3